MRHSDLVIGSEWEIVVVRGLLLDGEECLLGLALALSSVPRIAIVPLVARMARFHLVRVLLLTRRTTGNDKVESNQG